MLSCDEEILKEKGRSLSCLTSVLHFLKSPSGLARRYLSCSTLDMMIQMRFKKKYILLKFSFFFTLCVPCIILECVNDQRDAQFLLINFYSTVFCLLCMFRRNLVVHHQEHGIIYCITQFGTVGTNRAG
jgi:hypothetical protein